MKLTRKVKMLGLFGTLLVGIACGIQCNHPRGSNLAVDGVLTDSGFFSHYPRYRITFPTLSFMEYSRRDFSFHRAPATKLTFMLTMLPKGTTSFGGLQWSNANLRVEFLSDEGKSVALAEAPIQNWVTAINASTGVRDLWHPNLRDLRLDQSARYELVIELINSPSEDLVVRPVLEGGGFEF